MFDKAEGPKEAAGVKKVDLVAVSGQADFLSCAVWWSGLCVTATLLLSTTLTGLRANAETLLAASFNIVLSTHFWATAGAGTIVLTALSSGVREGNYTQKWNGSACRGKLEACCVRACIHTCPRVIECILVIIVFESMHICDCKRSYEEICWFAGARPLNTIFTAVSAPLF